MEKYIQNQFGHALRRARRQNSMTQSELSIKSDLGRSFISLLENGERLPSLSTVFIIAKAFDMKASDLIKQFEDVIEMTEE